VALRPLGPVVNHAPRRPTHSDTPLRERFTRGGDTVIGGAVNGAVDSMSELEDGLARARCTDDEAEARLVVLFRDWLLGHVTLELLHATLDAYAEQKEADELALLPA
jgi:hypothetical protein